MGGIESRAQFLREKRATPAVQLMEFMKLFSKVGLEGIYCFVEGEDSKYYSIRIRAKYPTGNLNFINSGGKKAVLKLYGLVTEKEEYKDAKILFFIDRDFDPPINNLAIYETPVYAIENFYTSLSSFGLILKMHFNLNEAHDDYDVCMELYKKLQTEFHKEMLLINAWIACQRELSNSGRTSRLDLQNVSLEKFVTLTLNDVVAKYDREQIKVLFPNAVDISKLVLDKKVEQFESLKGNRIFRGKYEIEFLRKFLELIRTEFGTGEMQIFHEKKKISIQLSKNNILSELGDCADIPSCLNTYLERMLGTENSERGVACGA